MAYLTSIFELHPTHRKAAALERIRSTYEDAFWHAMGEAEGPAVAALELGSSKDRRAEMAKIKAASFAVGRNHGLSEPLCQGLSRDVEQSASSFAELMLSGHDATWPRPAPEVDVSVALDAMSAAVTKEDEDEARDQWLRVDQQKCRPMTIARSRDAQIIRLGQNGKIGVSLNVLLGANCKANIKSGVDASSGEYLKAMKSATRLVVPVSCSKWTEYKFLNGNAILRSSVIYRRGGRWFMHAQFEMKAPEIEARSFIGIDRGIVNTLAAVAVRADGSVIQTPVVTGPEVPEMIRTYDKKAASARRRGAKSLPKYRSAADHVLHQIANSIVALAKEHRSAVVMENLSGLKSTITTRRRRGSRKNPWQRVLKRAQFGKLEQMLEYKLIAVGLPKPIFVPAGGTSMTCSACGHQHKDNRRTRDEFFCMECGFTADADVNAAIQIARRGMMKVKKGDKLVDLHKNMVAKLKTRDDGGLGPLLESSGKGLVAAHASGSVLDECLGTDNADLGQDITLDANQNANTRVLAERIGAFPGRMRGQLSLWDTDLLTSRAGTRRNAG